MTDESATEAGTEEAGLDPQKRGLGRGLNALFEDEESGGPVAGNEGGRQSLGIDQIAPGSYQPRKTMNDDALDELAASIAVHGILQPILVTPSPDDSGTYRIIAGERRWRAAQKAQLHEVPVIIKNVTDSTAYEIALIENLQREDLNALDEAAGYHKLQEEFQYTQEKLAAEIGKSRSHIANIMRLTNLPDEVQSYIRQGKLSAGHARALITADDPVALALEVIAKGLSVRETERLVAKAGGTGTKKKSTPSGTSTKPKKDVDTLALEEEISNVLGMKVTVDMKSIANGDDGQGGAGTLKVEFKSLDQLDEVLHRLSHYPGRQQSG